MASYSKLMKKRYRVLEAELLEYDKEISTITASMETILRDKARNIKDQEQRTTRFQELMGDLNFLMTKKEFIEQRMEEYEIMKGIVMDRVKGIKSKEES